MPVPNTPPITPQPGRSPAGAQRPGAQPAARGYRVPVTHEMTPAETEAQRRLVRASILADRS